VLIQLGSRRGGWIWKRRGEEGELGEGGRGGVGRSIIVVAHKADGEKEDCKKSEFNGPIFVFAGGGRFEARIRKYFSSSGRSVEKVAGDWTQGKAGG